MSAHNESAGGTEVAIRALVWQLVEAVLDAKEQLANLCDGSTAPYCAKRPSSHTRSASKERGASSSANSECEQLLPLFEAAGFRVEYADPDLVRHLTTQPQQEWLELLEQASINLGPTSGASSSSSSSSGSSGSRGSSSSNRGGGGDGAKKRGSTRSDSGASKARRTTKNERNDAPAAAVESQRRRRVVVAQIAPLKQSRNSSCGYYALFNVFVCKRLQSARSDEERRRYLEIMRSPAHFWSLYVRWNASLLSYARRRRSTCYPFTEECIESGVMERPYMSELLRNRNLPELYHLAQQQAITTLPDFGYPSLRYNEFSDEAACTMQRVLAQYQLHERYFHAIVIGQTMHWHTWIINKCSDCTEVILLDSRTQDFVLNFSADHLLHEHIETMNLALPERRRYLPRQKQSYYFMLLGTRWTSRLLYDLVLSEKSDVSNLLLEFNVDGFFEKFHAHTKPNLESQAVDGDQHLRLWNDGLLLWITSYFPPPVLESTILHPLMNFGVERFSDSIRIKFREWLFEVQKKTLQFTYQYDPAHTKLVTEFQVVLKRFEKIFQTPFNSTSAA